MFFRSGVDDETFHAYLEENQAMFYRLAFRYVNNKEEALDIVQDAIYKALVNKHKLKEKSYLKTWFYRIIVNCALDALRKKKKERQLQEYFVETIVHEEMKTHPFDLEEAFTKLDDKHRIIVILRFFEDMKIEEIAEVLQINQNTVKTRLYAALKKLRLEMRESDEE